MKKLIILLLITSICNAQLQERDILDIQQRRYHHSLLDSFDTLWDSLDSFNGIFFETMDFTVSESGGTVTGSLEQDGTGDLTQRFSDGQTVLDCTPAKTIDLTAYVGTDADPKEVFVYILQSAKTTIAASNSDWPATEHIKIANLLFRSAATTGTDDSLVNRNHNDHTQDSASQGHITHITQRIRQEHASYNAGVALTLKDSAGAVMSTTDSSTAIELVTSAGSVYQLHKQTFPATDMYSTAIDDAHVVNQPTDEGGAYETTTDLVTDITHYVDGTAAGVAIGTNKFFNLVIWGVQNRTGEASHIMINLPTGQYTTESNATADTNGSSVFDIPTAFKGTGFLIARLTFKLIAGAQWTYIAIEDLRGQFPGVSAGVGVSTTDHGLLSGLADDDHTQYLLADGTRALAGAWDLGGYDLNNGGVIFLTEQASAEADVAGKGQWWTKTATPNVPMFTDDTGVDGNLVRVVSVQYSNSDQLLATTGTSEQAYATTWTIPANYLVANKVLRVTVNFEQVSSNGPTHTARLRLGGLGGTVVVTGTVGTGTPGGGIGFVFTIMGTAAAGASVAVDTALLTATGTAGLGFGRHNTTTQPVNIATNASLVIQFTSQWSATTAGNSCNLRQLIIEEIN